MLRQLACRHRPVVRSIQRVRIAYLLLRFACPLVQLHFHRIRTEAFAVPVVIPHLHHGARDSLRIVLVRNGRRSVCRYYALQEVPVRQLRGVFHPAVCDQVAPRVILRQILRCVAPDRAAFNRHGQCDLGCCGHIVRIQRHFNTRRTQTQRIVVVFPSLHDGSTRLFVVMLVRNRGLRAFHHFCLGVVRRHIRFLFGPAVADFFPTFVLRQSAQLNLPVVAGAQRVRCLGRLAIHSLYQRHSQSLGTLAVMVVVVFPNLLNLGLLGLRCVLVRYDNLTAVGLHRRYVHRRIPYQRVAVRCRQRLNHTVSDLLPAFIYRQVRPLLAPGIRSADRHNLAHIADLAVYGLLQLHCRCHTSALAVLVVRVVPVLLDCYLRGLRRVSVGNPVAFLTLRVTRRQVVFLPAVRDLLAALILRQIALRVCPGVSGARYADCLNLRLLAALYLLVQLQINMVRSLPILVAVVSPHFLHRRVRLLRRISVGDGLVRSRSGFGDGVRHLLTVNCELNLSTFDLDIRDSVGIRIGLRINFVHVVGIGCGAFLGCQILPGLGPGIGLTQFNRFAFSHTILVQLYKNFLRPLAVLVVTVSPYLGHLHVGVLGVQRIGQRGYNNALVGYSRFALPNGDILGFFMSVRQRVSVRQVDFFPLVGDGIAVAVILRQACDHITGPVVGSCQRHSLFDSAVCFQLNLKGCGISAFTRRHPVLDDLSRDRNLLISILDLNFSLTVPWDSHRRCIRACRFRRCISTCLVGIGGCSRIPLYVNRSHALGNGILAFRQVHPGNRFTVLDNHPLILLGDDLAVRGIVFTAFLGRDFKDHRLDRFCFRSGSRCHGDGLRHLQTAGLLLVIVDQFNLVGIFTALSDFLNRYRSALHRGCQFVVVLDRLAIDILSHAVGFAHRQIADHLAAIGQVSPCKGQRILVCCARIDILTIDGDGEVALSGSQVSSIQAAPGLGYGQLRLVGIIGIGNGSGYGLSRRIMSCVNDCGIRSDRHRSQSIAFDLCVGSILFNIVGAVRQVAPGDSIVRTGLDINPLICFVDLLAVGGIVSLDSAVPRAFLGINSNLEDLASEDRISSLSSINSDSLLYLQEAHIQLVLDFADAGCAFLGRDISAGFVSSVNRYNTCNTGGIQCITIDRGSLLPVIVICRAVLVLLINCQGHYSPVVVSIQSSGTRLICLTHFCLEENLFEIISGRSDLRSAVQFNSNTGSRTQAGVALIAFPHLQHGQAELVRVVRTQAIGNGSQAADDIPIIILGINGVQAGHAVAGVCQRRIDRLNPAPDNLVAVLVLGQTVDGGLVVGFHRSSRSLPLIGHRIGLRIFTGTDGDGLAVYILCIITIQGHSNRSAFSSTINCHRYIVLHQLRGHRSRTLAILVVVIIPKLFDRGGNSGRSGGVGDSNSISEGLRIYFKETNTIHLITAVCNRLYPLCRIRLCYRITNIKWNIIDGNCSISFDLNCVFYSCRIPFL